MRVTRFALVALLATNIAAGSAFAPEHVHERDDHHPSATVHRHIEPHHARKTADHSQIDDDDEHVIWLTAAWLQSATYHGPTLISVPMVWTLDVPPQAGWAPLILDDAAPPHGPPRSPRSPRAPPLPA